MLNVEQRVSTLNVESQELISQKTILWFAGMFEAAGAIGFAITPPDLKGKIYTKPLITFNDRVEGSVLQLQELFGGAVRKKAGENSFEWRITGYEAASLVRKIVPYTPSRRFVAFFVDAWLKHPDIQTRVEIARHAKGNTRDLTVSSDDYESLVEIPEFVAGVYDARGGSYFDESGYEKVVVSSVNASLLEALKQQFGGNVYIHDHAGQAAKQYVLKRDSYVWMLQRKGLIEEFKQTIAPHTRFKHPD